MTNYKTEQEKQDKKFDEEFKCIQNDCDGFGNIPHQVDDGVWEAEQCQFHAEYLFPIKSYLLSHDTALLEAFKKDVGEMRTNKWDKCIEDFDHVNNTCRDCDTEKEHNDTIDTVLSLLKDYNLK